MNLFLQLFPNGRLHRRSLPAGISGFTLIELLVVISIIAILTTIGAASYQSAAKSGRDGKRKGDLSQVRAAMELYRSQQGSYPTGNYQAAVGILGTAGYMSSPLPDDPKGGSVHYMYTATGSPASSYVLCATIELTSNGNSTSTTSLTNTTPSAYYCVTQP